jgi:hypothetical protein
VKLLWRLLVCCITAVAAFGSVMAPARAAPVALPVPVTAGALPTPQTDGIVLSVAIVGNTVYAGGRFQKARPAGVAPGGAGEVTRTNLLAFDLTSGALLPWAPKVDNPTTSTTNPGGFCRPVTGGLYICDSVFRIKKSPDGASIYVGGDFTRVNDQTRGRIAKFTTASGVLDTTFTPQFTNQVRGISVTADTVYVGGAFSQVNGVNRSRLAAFTTTGTLKPWAPVADGAIYALQAAPAQGRVLLGGSFATVNGVTHHAMMSVDATTGANAPWASTVPAETDVVTDIATDGVNTAFYSAFDYNGPPVRFEGRAAFDIATGTAHWWDGCYGDTEAIAVAGNILYSASHTDDCTAVGAVIPPSDGSVRYYRLLAETTAATGTATTASNHLAVGDPVPTILPWFPTVNSGPPDSPSQNGPWSIDATSSYVVTGGEFTTVNGAAQQSLARFAARGVAGAINNGPQTPFRAPTLTRDGTGAPVITWTATWSAQTSDIRYEVVRTGTAQPIYTVSRSSRPWDLPQLTYTDLQATAGSYRIRAVDTDGTAISSPTSTLN